MSVYRLGSDAWSVILSYLDAQDTRRLLMSGDKTLQSCLKPAIRDFVACFATVRPPRLSSLLNSFKEHSIRPTRFSISLDTFYACLQFVPEDYTVEEWASFLPPTLESLELAIGCSQPPFSSLLESIDVLAPRLNKLCICNAPEKLGLPQTLTQLEISALQGWIVPSYGAKLFHSLPSTLTHLKFCHTILVKPDMTVSELPFRKMPLTFLHGRFSFVPLSKEQACWSILPNTITNLRAELRYGKNADLFENPSMSLSWKVLFPNLRSLHIPLSLSDESLIKNAPTALDGQISEEQIVSIRSAFPASLTELHLVPSRYNHMQYELPLAVRALGPQLRLYQYGLATLSPAVLQWLPKLENPKVKLLKTTTSAAFNREVLDEDENFEKFCFDKTHPISRLCPSATSLKPGILPASALSFLPKTIAELEFEVAFQEPLSLESALEASKRVKSNYNNVDTDNYNPEMGWKALGWPFKLTQLTLHLHQPQSLHFGCLPPTLKELNLYAWIPVGFVFEGGDLARMTELSLLRLTTMSESVITSLDGLPRSLNSISTNGKAIANDVFTNPDGLQNFCFLERMDIKGNECSADVLLYLPKSLKILYINLTKTGAVLSEEHFKGIFRTTLARLVLSGDAIWPDHLDFDVFSRYLPKSLVFFSLCLSDLDYKNLETKIAPHIPATLMEFDSSSSKLVQLVKARSQGKNMS